MQVRDFTSSTVCSRLTECVGQTEVRGASADDGDFLARERAALGEDADMFGTVNEARQTTVEDGDDDLLGGDFAAPSNQHSAQFDDDGFEGFESSFPAVDTTNAVSECLRWLDYDILTLCSRMLDLVAQSLDQLYPIIPRLHPTLPVMP